MYITELYISLMCTHTHTQIITVYPIEDDDDHYIAKLDDDSFGQIPKMYVELL